MASANLSAELECSVCLDIYTDPVMLQCGHNFCRLCIDRVLNTPDGSGGYSCPECREEFQERPTLQSNRKLRNIVENFLSAQQGQEQSGVFCTHCVDSPVPATVLQESDTGDLCDTEDGDDEDRERHDKLLHDGGGLDVAGILHTGLSDIITEVNVYFYIQEAADILLDVNTAHNILHISHDRKTGSWTDMDQNCRETPERFQDWPQVLSSQSFSSGRHYWDLDVGGSDNCRVGLCYPSMDRRGGQSLIGYNNKSWGLVINGNRYGVIHDSKGIPLSANISSNRVRVYLDYEAGRISFYDLCEPTRHLHTFTTTFTEPLCPVLWVWKGAIKICGGESGHGCALPRDWFHHKVRRGWDWWNIQVIG
ncbi:E3 ubiquitin-protein ligase TRIM39-like [Mantella aurantiaca]